MSPEHADPRGHSATDKTTPSLLGMSFAASANIWGWSSSLGRFRLHTQIMKKLCVFLSLILLVGCSIPNQARYQISSSPGATSSDKETVKEILQTAAGPLKLKEMNEASLVPNTIAYFQEIDSNTPVKLIAWGEGEKIFIELTHWPDQIGETLQYRSAREYIESELKRRFGERSSIVAFKKLAERRTPTKP